MLTSCCGVCRMTCTCLPRRALTNETAGLNHSVALPVHVAGKVKRAYLDVYSSNHGGSEEFWSADSSVLLLLPPPECARENSDGVLATGFVPCRRGGGTPCQCISVRPLGEGSFALPSVSADNRVCKLDIDGFITTAISKGT